MNTPLRLGIPSKGRLMEKTIEFFAEAGLKIETGGGREYAGRASGIDGIDVALMQAGEMPQALESGAIHLGVTGEDLIREKLRDADAATTLVKSMGFGRANLIVAVPQSWIDVETMADLDDAAAAFRAQHGFAMRVATKYLNLTRHFFREEGVAHYRIVESAGATEGTAAAGAAEIIVDITSSGETLKANHLKVLSGGTILRSQAQLRASRAASWGEGALGALQVLMDRIEARAAAKRQVLLHTSLPSTDALSEKLLATDAALLSVEGQLVTVSASRDTAWATAQLLREHGATRVDSSVPTMLYGAGAGEFERVAATLARA
jgi:ATP phosphoribosyltransferase